MGNCAAEDNPTFRVINNKNNLTKFNSNNPNDYPELQSVSEQSSNSHINQTHGGVYKISRIKKPSNKLLTKFNFISDTYPIQDNNTNKSTTSKSKYTESSYQSFSKGSSFTNIHSGNIERTNTLRSDKYGSVSDFPNANPEKDIRQFNKNFQEKKRLIRRKIHSSDKALEIMTEDELNKMKQKNVINNIANNRNNKSNINFKCIKSIVCHEDKIDCAIELFNGKIATGSYDGTIKIWDINLNFKNPKTIKEEGNVLCLLEFEDNMLLSGTEKNNINLWNLNTLTLTFSFKGHQLWVNSLTKINNIFFASCSNDNQIRIWDYKNRVCSKILTGHVNGILTLITLKDGCLCSGGADLSIKIWDLNKGNCKSTLLGHKK